MEEIWKPIKGYEGYYEISNMARVRAVDRIINGRRYRSKFITPYVAHSGYLAVTLCKDGKSICNYLHRLLAVAFIPNPTNRTYIDHINTDKTDCRIENLRWVTGKENANNPITKERIRINAHTESAKEKSLETKKRRGGITSPKPVYQFTMDGEFIRMYESACEAQRETGIRHIDISSCCRGNRGRKSCGGFLWSRTKTIPKYEPYKILCKKVARYNDQGELLKVYDSLNEAVADTGAKNITKCIQGERKHSGGYVWKFYEE